MNIETYLIIFIAIVVYIIIGATVARISFTLFSIYILDEINQRRGNAITDTTTITKLRGIKKLSILFGIFWVINVPLFWVIELTTTIIRLFINVPNLRFTCSEDTWIKVNRYSKS